MRRCLGAVNRHFDFHRVQVGDSLGHRLVGEQVAVRVDPESHPEATGLAADLEEILVAERLAAGERQIEDAELGDLAQRLEDLRRGHLLPAVGRVVAEGAEVIAPERQLELDGKRNRLGERFFDQLAIGAGLLGGLAHRVISNIPSRFKS